MESILVLIAFAVVLGIVNQAYTREGCREGITCDDVGCLGGSTGCAVIPCNGYPVLCLRP